MRNSKKSYIDKVKYTSDEKFLINVVLRNALSLESYDWYSLKCKALERISDQYFLYEFIVSNKDTSLRKIAIKNLLDENIKHDLLGNVDQEGYVEICIIDKVICDQSLLFECYKDVHDIRVWNNLLPKINQRPILVKFMNRMEESFEKNRAWAVFSIHQEIEKRLNNISPSLDFILSE